MTNRERTESHLLKALEEEPEKAITSICLVLSTEEAERILRRERATMLNKILSLLRWMNKQTESVAMEARPQIAELTEVINRIISER